MTQKDWKIDKLTIICNLEKGTEPGENSYCEPPEGTKFIRVGDITGKGNNSVNTTKEDVVKCQKEDILISVDGSPGVVVRGFEGAISAGIRIVKIKTEKIDEIDKNYLYHYLKTERVQKVIKKYTVTQNIAHASRSIPHIDIIYPSDIKIQENIGKILDKIENMIKIQEALKENSSDWINSVYVKIFGDPVVNPLKLPVPPIKEIVKKGKFSIKSGPFGSHLIEQELKDEGKRVLYPEELVDGKISNDDPKYVTEEKFEKLKMYLVKSGDVVISLMGTLGRVAVIPENFEEAIISKHLMKFSLAEDYLPEFFKYVLLNPTMLQLINLRSIGGIGQNNLIFFVPRKSSR